MTKNKIIIAAALATLITSGTALASNPADHGTCWGVAKAGQNDCKSLSGAHNCKGQSKVDNSPDDFKKSTKAECEAWNGMFKPSKPDSKAQ